MLKRIFSLALAAVLVLGMFSGCGKTTVTDLSQEPTKESTAKGRYVEQEMPLPEGGYALDMVQLNDGRIRVAVGKDEATVLLHGQGTVCGAGDAPAGGRVCPGYGAAERRPHPGGSGKG